MSLEQILELLSQKTACHEEVNSEARLRAQRHDELELISATYVKRLTIDSQSDVIFGEFAAVPKCSEGVTIVGPVLRRALQYPELCASQDAQTGSTYNLNRLPPVYFRFYLGDSYPANPSFSFTLESLWLSPLLIDLVSARLTEEMRKSEGNSAVKRCCEFLENEMIPYLFPTAPICINLFEYMELDEPCTAEEGRDKAYRLADLMVGYEEQIRNQEFTDAAHECLVCMEQLPGSQCIRFRKCGHVVCRECAAASFVEQIAQGTNACEPTCVKCAETVRQQEIRAVVTEDQYALYEQRLLNRTLANMPDIVACPNTTCNFEHVRLTDERDQGVCPMCRFHFCARCRAAFHEGKPCQTGDLTNLTPDKVAEVVARYKEAGVDGRAQMELQYGKDNLNKLITEYDTNKLIKKECKHCPKCNATIYKTEGCNKMRCTRCNTIFCWNCLAILNPRDPYAHFGYGCSMR